MVSGKIERVAIFAIVDYLDNCPLLESIVNYNDKRPFWDGDIYVYKDGQKGSRKDNFYGRVPIILKGRTDNRSNFRINRAEAEAYMNDGGCLFFKVLVKEDLSSTILYSILSRSFIAERLQQCDGDIDFHLEIVPPQPS